MAISDSDASDPTFQPSRSPSLNTSPRPESSAQAQSRAAYDNTVRTTTIRSRSHQTQKGSSSHSKSTPARYKAGSSSTKQSSARDSNAQIQEHHPGPFTSSPHPGSLRSLPLHPSSVSPQPGHSSGHLGAEPLSINASALSPYESSPSPARADPSKVKSSQIPSDLPPHRPNRFYGPPSTYRSWIEQERTVAQSLERSRAQDLSIHLYNAHALRRKAELSRLQHGGRSRSRSRNRATSQTRGKSKGKARSRADSDDDNVEDAESREPATQLMTNTGVDDEGENYEQVTFNPPRLWTAWPLPPNEVPREEFLSHSILRGAYRSQKDPRPSAELEECLIAILTRFAREKWEARQWESDDESIEEGPDMRPKKRRRKSENEHLQNTDFLMKNHNDNVAPDQDVNTASTIPSSNSSTPDPDVPTFSSQMFAPVSSSSSEPNTSISTSSSRSPSPQRPVFSADDEHIRTLVLPSTRHVLSKLDNLLRALHVLQVHWKERKRKVGDVGERGAEEILGLAELCFGRAVGERTRTRWDSLMREAG